MNSEQHPLALSAWLVLSSRSVSFLMVRFSLFSPAAPTSRARPARNPLRLSKYFGWLAVACLWLTIAAASQAAEPTEWRVGLARVKITPEGPLAMGGYGPRVSDGVLDDLDAKALAIEASDGSRAVLVTADLLFFRAPTSAAICQRICTATGLRRQQILLNASHTHASPLVGMNADLDSFQVPPAERERVRVYTEWLEKQLTDLVVRAIADLQPARLSWQRGEVEFPMNRRLSTGGGIGMSPNPAAFVDRRVPVLRVESPAGRCRAILFGCACHPATLDGQNRKLSGDFAGVAQHEIEARYPDVQALFLAGCGGDANPEPRGGRDQEQLVRQHGRRLAAEVGRVMDGPMQALHGTLRAELNWLELPLEHALPRERLEELGRRSAWHARNVQAVLQRRQRSEAPITSYRAPLAVWQIGQQLTLVCLPGEAVAEYVLLLERALGKDGLWLAAYGNESFGYLPTKRILEEGGHESMCLTLDAGLFAPEVQDVVVEAVSRLARQAGRKP